MQCTQEDSLCDQSTGYGERISNKPKSLEITKDLIGQLVLNDLMKIPSNPKMEKSPLLKNAVLLRLPIALFFSFVSLVCNEQAAFLKKRYRVGQPAAVQLGLQQ